MVDHQTIERANARAQRRLRAMIVSRVYADPNARATRLYVQAERLLDALLGEAQWYRSKAEMDALQTADHDIHERMGWSVHQCDECLTAAEPGHLWTYQRVPESELRALHGDR